MALITAQPEGAVLAASALLEHNMASNDITA
jgi:hypothetical protein